MTEHEGTTSFPTPPPPNMPEEAIFASPPPRRNPATYVAVLIGLVAMAGGAVFFARSLGTAEGGADTPVAAVQRMFDAIEDEDALGVLESLLPSERDTLSDSVQTVAEELGRLGILREDLDLGSIEGIELDFTGLSFTSEDLANDVSVVSLTGGSVTYRIDPARTPLGDFVRGFMSDEDSKVVEGTDTVTGEEDGFFATVKQGDKWFVSLWYSVAEGVRRSAGAPLPRFGDGILARGEATPEAAVEQFIRSAVLLDVRRLIELTPPEEARALHDYAPLFIDAAEAGAREARNHYSAEVTGMKLNGTQSGDRAVVTIAEAQFKLDIPELGFSVDYDGECATVKGDFLGFDRPQRQCGGGIVPAAGLPEFPRPEIGFVAVRENGEWYVSPTRTVLDGLIATLKALDRQDLESFVQIFGGMSGG